MRADAERGENERERRRSGGAGAEKRASRRAAASPWRGIYDVISSLTVNNFPRGCGRHRVPSPAATVPSVPPLAAPRQGPRTLFPSRPPPATVSLSTYLGLPLPPFSSLCKLKRRRRASWRATTKPASLPKSNIA